MAPQYNRLNLKCPCFDLSWLLIPSNDALEEKAFVLIPGGGGSTKSGVHNIIHIAKISKITGQLEFINSFETGDLLCNSISTGIIKNTAVVCASFEETCHVYTVKIVENNLIFENKSQ